MGHFVAHPGLLGFPHVGVTSFQEGMMTAGSHPALTAQSVWHFILNSCHDFGVS